MNRTKNEIILDIETICDDTDYEAYCQLFPKKKKAKEAPALHPCTCRVVCVGLKPVCAEPVILFHENEKELLSLTRLCLEELCPSRIITFNGTTFDFPVLVWRAARHGIDGLGRLLPRSKDVKNYDIYQKIRWTLPLSLSEISMLLFGEPKVYSGDRMDELFREGRYDEIISYNRRDLEIIEAVYLRRDDLL